MSTLDTRVGFAGDTAPAGTRRPGTEWPVQRFLWSDYDPPREAVSYQAVPLTGDKDALVDDAAHATDWSDPVKVTADAGDGISAQSRSGFRERGMAGSAYGHIVPGHARALARVAGQLLSAARQIRGPAVGPQF